MLTGFIEYFAGDLKFEEEIISVRVGERVAKTDRDALAKTGINCNELHYSPAFIFIEGSLAALLAFFCLSSLV